MKLGLVCAPEIPEKIGQEISPGLPALLGEHVDGVGSWDVHVVCHPLTGAGRDAPEILDACRERMLEEGWNLAICLTDLPIYRAGRLVVADASADRGVAGVSLPALGATRLRPRTLEATVQLASELCARIPDLRQDDPSQDVEKGAARADAGTDAGAEAGASDLPGRPG